MMRLLCFMKQEARDNSRVVTLSQRDLLEYKLRTLGYLPSSKPLCRHQPRGEGQILNV